MKRSDDAWTCIGPSQLCRKHNMLMLAMLICIISINSAAAWASRDNMSWVGYQNDCMFPYPEVAAWAHGDNWWNYTIPDSSDWAYFGTGFDPGGDYYPRYLYFGSTCIDDFDCPQGIQLDACDAVISRLMIPDDDWVFDMGPGNVGPCFPDSFKNGSLTVLDWITIGSPTDGGDPGNASLEIRNGRLHLDQTTGGHSGHIGSFNPGGHGELTVNGPDAIWEFSAFVLIGVTGPGTVNVINGGEIYGERFEVAEFEGGSGTINVSGAGSELTLYGSLDLGFRGEGFLNVTGGAHATTGYGMLGHGLSAPGAYGEVLVSGSGSTLRFEDNLFIGGSGSGLATVEQSGFLFAKDLGVGYQNLGTLDVESGGQVFSNSDFKVGWFSGSTGYFNLGGEGFVQSQRADLGERAGSEGYVTVTGGSAWESIQRLRVGYRGTGHLAIDDGSVVSQNTEISIGRTSTAIGDVHVSGAGSILQGGEVYIGFGGSGLLELEAGAKLLGDYLALGDSTGSSGQLIADGSQTEIIIDGSVEVGRNDGSGSVALRNGAALACEALTISEGGEFSGEGVVSTSTLFTNADVLRLGSSVGTLSVISDLSQLSTGSLIIDIAGSEPGIGHDLLQVEGGVTLAGSLVVEVDAAYEPPQPSAYEFLVCSQLNGEFDEVIIPEYEAFLSYTDSSVILWIGASAGVEEEAVQSASVLRYGLDPCLPNPISSHGTIGLRVPAPGGQVRLSVFDVSGRRIRSLARRHFGPGHHELIWLGKDDNGRAVTSGVYLVTMEAPGFRQSREIVLLK